MTKRTHEHLLIPTWGALLSSLFMIVGWNWDISWHRSIGRDTVWTLPHIAIYVALAIAFAYNSWLVLSYTFGALKKVAALRVFGFRGPSGAFVTLWGILLQFTGILFDDWWHGVYGLDVGVFSPAHLVLAGGIHMFYVGQFLIIALHRNSVLPQYEKVTRWMAVGIAAVFVAHVILGIEPFYGPLAVRSYAFVISAATVSLAFVAIHRYLEWRWAGTMMAGLYMLGVIVLMQIFQLFPATPRFGPVYHHVVNFLPPMFPLLLVVPGLVMDSVLGRMHRPRMRTAVVLGLIFVITFNVTNLAWSEFLTSSWADNRFFGGGYPGSFFEEQFREAPLLNFNKVGLLAVLAAIVLASVMAQFGMRFGTWLREIVR